MSIIGKLFAKKSVSTADYQIRDIIEAAKSKNIRKVKSIIEKKPGLAASKDKDGMTPVHFCAALNQVDIVELLLSKGADINARNNGGWTPLHFAALQGHLEMVKVLLIKGADNEIHGQGTPLSVAIQQGNQRVKELLQSYSSKSRMTGEKTANELLKDGIEKLNRQEWKEAVKVLTRSIELMPDFAKAHQLMFIAYGGLMDGENAMKHYEILKKLDLRLVKELEASPSFSMIQRLGPMVKF